MLLFSAGALVADATPLDLLDGGALGAAFGVRIEALQSAGGLVVGASLPPAV